mmetsp:Transcript_11628/g.40705  ORF Transcript_11628/g.40705 Transcript_11628/m.40705 type:complete len:383 (-) Transcript_11628:139-1287(-)
MEALLFATGVAAWGATRWLVPRSGGARGGAGGGAGAPKRCDACGCSCGGATDFDLDRDARAYVPAGVDIEAAAASLPHASELTERDRALVARAYALRDAHEAPIHSAFNVIAIITCEAPDGSLFTVTGANNETCNIGGSLCAERSALAKLRFHDYDRLVSVHIVTSSPNPVTPGMLCREYLSELAPQSLRVVVHAADACMVTTLGALLPLPPLYAGVRRRDVVGYARRFAQVGEKAEEEGAALLGDGGLSLFRAVVETTTRDARDLLYPLRLAAGVLFDDGSTSTAAQNKMVEYGSTVDPVTKLAQAIEAKAAAGVRPTLVLMADQFGVLHAPWARARSYLYEEDFDDCEVVAHDRDGRLHRVTVATLVPEIPKFDWGGNAL